MLVGVSDFGVLGLGGIRPSLVFFAGLHSFFDANFWGFLDLTGQRAKFINFWRRKFDKNKIKISMTSYNQFYAIFSAKFH